MRVSGAPCERGRCAQWRRGPPVSARPQSEADVLDPPTADGHGGHRNGCPVPETGTPSVRLSPAPGSGRTDHPPQNPFSAFPGVRQEGFQAWKGRVLAFRNGSWPHGGCFRGYGPGFRTAWRDRLIFCAACGRPRRVRHIVPWKKGYKHSAVHHDQPRVARRQSLFQRAGGSEPVVVDARSFVSDVYSGGGPLDVRRKVGSCPPPGCRYVRVSRGAGRCVCGLPSGI